MQPHAQEQEQEREHEYEQARQRESVVNVEGSDDDQPGRCSLESPSFGP